MSLFSGAKKGVRFLQSDALWILWFAYLACICFYIINNILCLLTRPLLEYFLSIMSILFFQNVFIFFCLYEAASLRGLWWRSKSWWGCSDLPGFTRLIPDYHAVNGIAHAVMQLDIEFGEHIIGHVPDSSVLCYVPSDKHLNGLVLGRTLVTVRAVIWLYTAATIFSMTFVSSFFWSSCCYDTRVPVRLLLR